ncbi:MAG TPA: alpha/beta fold hydrolase [Rhizomicrobium sp.]
MSQAWRLGFEFSAGEQKHSVDDARWSLTGLDPATRVRTGAFTASDREDVPYRLWPATAPRALVLLLHGACDYSGAFDEIGPLLAARGLTAMAIDQRGFGATSTRGKWRGKNRMIRDAIEAVLFLRMRYGQTLPVFVLGESMGAALAVHVASRAPDLDLAGLVLSAPGAISGTWRRLFGTAITRILRWLAPGSGIVLERLSAWEFTPAAAIRLLSDPMVMRRIGPAALFGLFKLSRSAVDEADHVRVPVLTMTGTKEDVLRLDCIRRLHDGLAGDKTWESFEGGPHLLLHWQHNGRVLDKVVAWLEARLTAHAGAYKVGIASTAIRRP